MSLLFTHEKSTMQELSNMHKAAEKGNDFDSNHDFVTSPSNWTGQNEKFYVAEKWEFSDAKVWLLWRRRWEGRRRPLGCWARGRYYTALSTLPTEPTHTSTLAPRYHFSSPSNLVTHTKPPPCMASQIQSGSAHCSTSHLISCPILCQELRACVCAIRFGTTGAYIYDS